MRIGVKIWCSIHGISVSGVVIRHESWGAKDFIFMRRTLCWSIRNSSTWSLEVGWFGIARTSYCTSYGLLKDSQCTHAALLITNICPDSVSKFSNYMHPKQGFMKVADDCLSCMWSCHTVLLSSFVGLDLQDSNRTRHVHQDDILCQAKT